LQEPPAPWVGYHVFHSVNGRDRGGGRRCAVIRPDFIGENLYCGCRKAALPVGIQPEEIGRNDLPVLVKVPIEIKVLRFTMCGTMRVVALGYAERDNAR
jgi:hypothetical protein